MAVLRSCEVVRAVAVVLLVTLLLPEAMADTKHVVCYYASWAHYRQGLAKYTVEDIPVELCTHLIYAFAILDPKTFLAKQHDPWLDNDLKNYEKFVDLKKKNPNIKVLLGLGGWNDSRSNKYSKMVIDAERRGKFVEEVVKLLLQYGFDGLDLDWEYPGYDGGPSTDKQGFTDWLVDLKSAFRPHNLMLTAAVSAGRHTIDRGYDVPKVAKLLDLIHLMSYDFHGSWEKSVAHHSPLYAETGQNPELCSDFAVNYWIKKGAPAHKIVMGVPLYGRSWTLAGSENFPGAAARGAGREGRHIKAAGNLAFFECCLAHKKEGWTKVTGDGGPYITKGDQWVGYDDVDAVKKKAEYAVSRGLGGIMVWDTATDDFGNYCGLGHNPLMTAIAKTLNVSTLSTIPEPSDRGPTSPPAESTSKKPLGDEKTKGAGNLHLHSREGDMTDTADTNRTGGANTARKNGSVGVKNNLNDIETTTTKLPYPWLAWPFFSQSPVKKQNRISTLPLHFSSQSSPSFSPSQFNSQLFSSSLTSTFDLKSRTSTTTTPPPFSHFPGPSSSSSGASWFAECAALGFAPDPVSCNTFYRCTNNYAYKFDCPGGLLWHQDLSSCDWPNAVQCILPLNPPDLQHFLPPKVSQF